ncbi:VanZ family protein [Paenibacillus sp. 1P03SA]|uniref:VanZ family protein n=1 Tax=Paenibacillus sp. 1P03SA TaxID=3132294 RepID=UPI0039A255AF
MQPLLHKLFTKEEIHDYFPQVTVRYHHTIIRAQSDPMRFIEFIFRKTAHLVVYAVLAALAYRALSLMGNGRGKRLLFSLLYVILIATGDEWVQSAAAMRTSAIQDVILDTAGGLAGLAAAVWAVPEGIRFWRASNRIKRREAGR